MSIYSTPAQADKALMKANSTHECRFIAEWIDMDDSLGHVECSCGWHSRGVKVCWLGELAIEHVENMERRERA